MNCRGVNPDVIISIMENEKGFRMEIQSDTS